MSNECLFIGGSRHGETLNCVGEYIKIPVPLSHDIDSGMLTYREEVYISARVLLTKQQRAVKVMRIEGMSDSVLLAELEHWQFTPEGNWADLRTTGDD